MLDGLACLMVLHGLLKVTGVQRNPGVGGLARHPSPSHSSTSSHRSRRARSEEITFVKSLEYLCRRREELVDVFQRSISDDVVAVSITSSCASRIIDCPEKVQEKDN